MTQEHVPAPGTAPAQQEPEAGTPSSRRIAHGQLAQLWRTEVPKVVQRHEAELLQVRRALGLIC